MKQPSDNTFMNCGKDYMYKSWVKGEAMLGINIGQLANLSPLSTPTCLRCIFRAIFIHKLFAYFKRFANTFTQNFGLYINLLINNFCTLSTVITNNTNKLSKGFSL